MPGPIDSLLFVHRAILREADDLEQAITSATDPTTVGALAERIEYFGRLVDGHTRGEEVGLFPRLTAREETTAETYLHDHVEERALFAELAELAAACQGGDTAALARSKRQIVALATHVHSHVTKENELILPRVGAHFSPEEQGQIVQDILSVFSPEDTAAAVPWIVGRLDADTAASYVTALSRAMPPAVFEAAKGWIRSGIDDDQWSALVARAPVVADT